MFYHDDVVEFRVIANGATWIKWFMRFKDGKIAIVTSHVDDPMSQGGTKISLKPIDGAFGDLLFKEVKRCPDCGAIVSDDMNFCGECGKRLR